MTMVVRNLAGGDLGDHDSRADHVGGPLFSTGTRGITDLCPMASNVRRCDN